ncbi:MAG TPA: Lin0512 family protein [Clostridia bacterium]|nr:Lin0512 family protein [Clostridia bacterium]
MNRYIIEFGLGMDFHGQDVNNAAKKAVKDAISKSCLCGLSELFKLNDLDNDINIKVTVAVSRPAEIDAEAIVECLPVGKVSVQSVQGGMTVAGLYLPRFGDRDESIEAALAAVEVFVHSDFSATE